MKSRLVVHWRSPIDFFKLMNILLFYKYFLPYIFVTKKLTAKEKLARKNARDKTVRPIIKEKLAVIETA